jgi:hypothetical protein
VVSAIRAAEDAPESIEGGDPGPSGEAVEDDASEDDENRGDA